MIELTEKQTRAGWRAIYRSVTAWEEKATLSTKTYSWSRTYVHRLVLSCGHKEVRRGGSCPTTKVKCKSCLLGVPHASLEGVTPGRFDKTVDAKIEAPIASALLDKGMARNG